MPVAILDLPLSTLLYTYTVGYSVIWENKRVQDLGFPTVPGGLELAVSKSEKLQELLTKREPVNTWTLAD